MRYPSIEEYKTAVGIPESFSTLHYLIPVMDKQDFSIFIAGGPAVVFKMQDSRNSKKLYALKCFTQEQAQRKYHFEEIHKYLKKLNSPYLVDYQYLENELWVDDREYPVLLMEWIEGETMSQKIGELCEANDRQGIARLTYNFNKMAIWLLQKDFAHGDIKPENIQITLSGDLKLLDYDGMFVPALAGRVAPELGTAEYRQPMRTETDFNEHLDDFPLLVLSLSLLSLQKRPELYNVSKQGDSLLFTPEDYKALYLSEHYALFTREMVNNQNINLLFGLLQYAIALPVLKLIGLKKALEEINGRLMEKHKAPEARTNFDKALSNSLKQLNTNLDKLKPVEFKYDHIFNKFLDECSCGEFRSALEFTRQLKTNRFFKSNGPTWTDKHGVIYDISRMKLIDAQAYLRKYTVLEGTFTIEDAAFANCVLLEKIVLPNSLKYISYQAFSSCSGLLRIRIPDGIESISQMAFAFCSNLTTVKLPNNLKTIEGNAFTHCYKLQKIDFPHTLSNIQNNAFKKCIKLEVINLPNGLKAIGKSAFGGCENIREIRLPRGLRRIDKSCFEMCNNIERIYIPKGKWFRFKIFKALEKHKSKFIEY